MTENNYSDVLSLAITKSFFISLPENFKKYFLNKSRLHLCIDLKFAINSYVLFFNNFKDCLNLDFIDFLRYIPNYKTRNNFVHIFDLNDEEVINYALKFNFDKKFAKKYKNHFDKIFEEALSRDLEDACISFMCDNYHILKDDNYFLLRKAANFFEKKYIMEVIFYNIDISSIQDCYHIRNLFKKIGYEDKDILLSDKRRYSNHVKMFSKISEEVRDILYFY